MGTIIHDVICVTGCGDHIKRTHEFAVGLLGDLVTPIGAERTNGYRTFFVEPDGSKEWWPESDEIDPLREQLLAFLSDDDLFVEWTAVRYGSDLGDRSHGMFPAATQGNL